MRIELNSFDGIIDRLDIKPTASGPLNGLTFAVKDMFDLVGHTSGFGTPAWKRTHSPALKNAPAVQQLLDAGAHLKANACADELACSLDGINVHFGTPINPQASDRIPGGSSSGPASVVASGEVDFALGTDTAGSVRVPASYCGIFGFRPSHDYISAEGVLPLGPSFDTVGVLARSSDLLQLVSNTLLKNDNGDDNESSHSSGLAGFATLILPEQFESVLDPLMAPYMMAFVEELKRKFETISVKPIYKLGREVYDVFTTVRAREAWLSHGEWLERVKPDLARSIRQRIYSCKEISDEDFKRASSARAALLDRSDDLVDRNSIICLPTTWGPPPLLTASESELQDNRNRNICITTLASCYGFPQVSIPIPAGKMKLGISLMSAKGTDRALLRLVNAYCGTS
jgi:amidase